MSTDVVMSETVALCATALVVGFCHTILGPDHYVPFAAMARAGGWSPAKTLRVTVACGLGHVAGSVALGLAGLALGVVVLRLEGLEALRGEVAGWLLVAFGLAYAAWGVVQTSRGGPHEHVHARATGTGPAAPHGRQSTPVRVADAAAASVWAPWLLFLVFVFGPCEPLIPLLIVPAARANGWAVAAVVAAFAGATVATMATAVLAVRYGVGLVERPQLRRHAHALAGVAILVCGVLVKIGL